MNESKHRDALLEIELSLVQEILLKELKSGDHRFDVIVDDWLSQRGKMLRPAFYLLSSRFGLSENQLKRWQVMAENNPEAVKSELQSDERQLKFIRGAAGIELIHMASLIHDDVIDEAKLRRGRPSIQYRHGKDYAVYMGDYFFCKAVLLVSDHEQKDSLNQMAKAMTQVCLGEVRQYHSRHLLEPNLREYFKIISGKTAALFALSFYAGALEGGMQKQEAINMGKVGYNMGMAFQIIDDLLDYEVNEAFGKETYKDLSQGNINLPIHLALMTPNGKQIQRILGNKDIDFDKFAQVVKLIKSAKADEGSSKYAEKFTKRALKYLGRAPMHPTREHIERQIVSLLSRRI